MRAGHNYTPQEREFLVQYIPGHTYQETQEAFAGRFGWRIGAGQLEGCMARWGIRNGRDARFKCGHTPHNKGVKGFCPPGAEKTWFPKGIISRNRVPVGSEHIQKGDYVFVKVAEPDVWRPKHHIVYEQAYGKIPEGHIIIFKDNNKRNFSPDNLMAITRSENAVLNRRKLYRYTGDMKETAVLIADVKIAARKAEKRKAGRKA